jgi:predicted nucleic acid-binding protein
VIVLDASAVLELLLASRTGTALRQRILEGAHALHAPHLIDVEVAHVLRRYERTGGLSAHRGRAAVEDLASLRMTRHPHDLLLPRIWELRANLTGYDAAYLALAELLDAPLWTRDARLADRSVHRARVAVV